MKKLMTRHFAKWAKKRKLSINGLSGALDEVGKGSFEADLGGHLVKKRIRFQGQGKSGSGRTIICYKEGDLAIFIHGFSKKEKSNLSSQELVALKEFAKVLVKFSPKELSVAIEKCDFIEVE